MTRRESLARYFSEAERLGLTYREADAVRRDGQRPHTIWTRECNGEIERGDDGIMYQNCNINGPGPMTRYKIADRETPAQARIEAIAKAHGCAVVWQTDPRGWPLTICAAADVQPDGTARRGACPPVRS